MILSDSFPFHSIPFAFLFIIDGLVSGMNVLPTEYCTLTWEQRLIGFISCFSVGLILSFLSTLFTSLVFMGQPQKFAVCYSFGAIVSMGSSMFLMGPCTQLKSMFDQTRVVTTSVYLLSVMGTLCCALVLKNTLAVLLMLLVQFIALGWYCLSYIPYGREFVISCMRTSFAL